VLHSLLAGSAVLQPHHSCEGAAAERGGNNYVQRFRGGLVFKAHRLLYHSTLGLRVIKKKKREQLSRVQRLSPDSNDQNLVMLLLLLYSRYRS